MPTIAEQLTQLESDRSDLVDNLETMGITGLSGDETFTELVPEVLNISGGGVNIFDYFNNTITGGGTIADIIKKVPDNITVSGTYFGDAFRNYKGTYIPQLDTTNVTDTNGAFRSCPNITTIPLLNTSNVTNMESMFSYDYALISVPQLDTSKVEKFGSMFNQCSSLTTVPVFNASSANRSTSFNSMYNYCHNLTNQSLDNILQMCISAIQYTGTKTLATLGLTSSYYPASTIQGLTHYQDFINAGWTIGY